MTDKQPEALLRADELEAIGAESSLARAMAAHTIRLLYKEKAHLHEENELLKARLAQLEPPCKTGSQCVSGKCTQCEAQPEPEPVAWIENVRLDWLTKHGDKPDMYALVTKHESGYDIPLYTAPPKKEWVGLTDEEYETMAETYVTNCYFDTLKYAFAIEAKLKEKNNG